MDELRPESESAGPDWTDRDFFRRLLDNLHDGVYFVDVDRRVTYWNRAAQRLTGFRADEVVGRYCQENILMHTDEAGTNLCVTGCPLLESMQSGRLAESDVYLRHREGHRVPVLIRVAPIRDGQGRVVGAVEIFGDNSSKLAAIQRAQELEQMAFIDSLTGVGNRRYVETTLRNRLNEFERYGWTFGALLVDVDHFKQVNDRFGHPVGDALLQVIARTLSQSVRPFDLVGRWGGDEFICVLEHVTLDKLASLAERCRALVMQSQLPAAQDGLRPSISMGGTIVREGDALETLIERADQNLYEVKQAGRGRLRLS